MQKHKFLTQINCVTGSSCMTQMDYREEFGERNVPAKSAINHCAWKLERTRSIPDEHRRQCWLMSEAVIVDMCASLECSPIWCLHSFLHESGYSYSASQRTANKAKVPPFRVTVIYQQLEPEMQKQVSYCQCFPCFLQNFKGILSVTWHVDETWFHLSYLLTYSMVQSPSWEANWFAASQEIPRISRNPKVHYRTHKRPPPVSILVQPNPVHIHTTHLLEIHPNIIHPSTSRSPQWSPSLRFPHGTPDE